LASALSSEMLLLFASLWGRQRVRCVGGRVDELMGVGLHGQISMQWTIFIATEMRWDDECQRRSHASEGSLLAHFKRSISRSKSSADALGIIAHEGLALFRSRMNVEQISIFRQVTRNPCL